MRSILLVYHTQHIYMYTHIQCILLKKTYISIYFNYDMHIHTYMYIHTLLLIYRTFY